MSNSAIIAALRLQVERLQADLDYEQRAHKNLMIDFMKVEGPTSPTRSTLLAKAEALEELRDAPVWRSVEGAWQATKGVAAEYRKQAEGES